MRPKEVNLDGEQGDGKFELAAQPAEHQARHLHLLHEGRDEDASTPAIPKRSPRPKPSRSDRRDDRQADRAAQDQSPPLAMPRSKPQPKPRRQRKPSRPRLQQRRSSCQARSRRRRSPTKSCSGRQGADRSRRQDQGRRRSQGESRAGVAQVDAEGQAGHVQAALDRSSTRSSKPPPKDVQSLVSTPIKLRIRAAVQADAPPLAAGVKPEAEAGDSGQVERLYGFAEQVELTLEPPPACTGFSSSKLTIEARTGREGKAGNCRRRTTPPPATTSARRAKAGSTTCKSKRPRPSTSPIKVEASPVETRMASECDS